MTSRRCERARLFTDAEDNLRFLEIVGEVCSLFYVSVFAYCLMVNHFHLVLRTADANLARVMHRINGKFAQWWNRRHLHAGHVLEHRYDAQVIDSDVYLLNACRYTVQNPVRAQSMAQTPGDWPWSSHRAVVGIDEPPPWLDVDAILAKFGDDRASAIAAYRRFVEGPQPGTPLIGRDIPIVGDSEFRSGFRKQTERASREVTRWDRLAATPPLNEVFAGAITRTDRDARIGDAFRLGYTMAEIARHLQLHYSTISRILTRCQMLKNAGGQVLRNAGRQDLTPTG